MLKQVIIVFIFSLSTLLFFSSGVVESQDGQQYLTIARQIYYYSTFAMPDAKYPENNIHMNVTKGVDGKEYSPTGLGFSLAYLPAVMMEDIFNQAAGIAPSQKFPLDNDWPVMLFASMTNAVFGALFITTFFLLLRSYRYSSKTALILSLVLFSSSNLFEYSKHGFAHMMFISFLFLSFFWLRQYRLRKQAKYVMLAAVSYGVVVLSYNPTFLLPLPALGAYYLSNIQWSKYSLVWKKILRDGTLAVLAIFPFLSVYSWFNLVRFGSSASSGYGAGSIPIPTVPPAAFVIYEGFWGLLFSPGKSVFLFTPILLILFLFWFKFKRRYLPEIITTGIIAGVYLFFIASLVGGVDYFPWHGEASFGPRYLLPILPFGLLLVALLFRELTVWQKRLAFWPLISVGLAVQLVGTLVPYQVRFAGLDYQYYLNGHRITYNEYANFIPRFSPLYSMAKWGVRLLLNVPLYYFDVPNVVIVDGVHGVFKSEAGPVRELEPKSVTFADTTMVKDVAFTIHNYIATTSAQLPVKVLASVAGQETASKVIEPGETNELSISLASLPQSPQLPIVLDYSYEGTTSAKVDNQRVILSGIKENGTPISIEHLRYPYVSRVSQKLQGIQYYYWGNENLKLWRLWEMRSINYVHTLDLWWLRPFHYWDLPKNFYLGLFVLNCSVFLTSGFMLYKWLSPKSN